MLAVVFEVEVRGAEREVGVELWFIRRSVDQCASWRGFGSDDRGTGGDWKPGSDDFTRDVSKALGVTLRRRVFLFSFFTSCVIVWLAEALSFPLLFQISISAEYCVDWIVALCMITLNSDDNDDDNDDESDDDCDEKCV